ncbi:MAG: glycoside hydrolase family 76 protein [Candidatus Saccharimonadales bacterium]
MPDAEPAVEVRQPISDVATGEMMESKSRWPLKIAALGMSALLTVGFINNERLTNYAWLAKANLEHVVGEAPDPSSFDYLDQYKVGNGLFTNDLTGDYTKIWPHSQALSALHILSLIPGHSSEYEAEFQLSLKASDSYWAEATDTTRAGYNASLNSTNFGSPERYVDDNLWMGLIHMQEFKANRDQAQLERAEQIFDLALRQWDEQNGGIFWQVQWPDAADHTRAMVSNAPAVQLGADLYRQTGNKDYLPKIEEIFNWMLQHKDEPAGVFNDHIRDDETYDLSKYTYVQGVAIGAMTEMSQIMPDKYSLQDAVDLANITLDQLSHGALLGNPEFDAILYRNLLEITGPYNHPGFTKRVLKSLQTTVDNLPKSPKELLEFVGTIQLRAMLAVPESERDKLF